MKVLEGERSRSITGGVSQKQPRSDFRISSISCFKTATIKEVIPATGFRNDVQIDALDSSGTLKVVIKTAKIKSHCLNKIRL